MATRRKYKPKAYRDGGRVLADAPIAEDATLESAAGPPAASPSEPERNRLIEALAAQKRAEALQRHHAAQPQPTHQAPPQAPQLPEVALAWLQRHPEFAQDPVLNGRLGAVHNYLTVVDGIEPFSPAYFDALNTKFGFKAAPAAPAPAPAAPQRRSIPMSAPVAREIPGSNGRRGDGAVTLSPEERDIARRSIMDHPGQPNLTNAEKEYLYAQNKLKLARMKRDGTYSDQGNG